MSDTVQLWVCPDCYFYVAGGDVENVAATEKGIDRIKADNRPLTVDIVPGGDHDENCDALELGTDCECEIITFTWNRCELCLSPLGGDRYAVTVFYGEPA